MENKIYLPDIVGKGYKEYWYFKGRFRVCKGSRASKKSKTTALNFIFRIMQYKDANLLVVRKTYNTLRDSCFAELKWAIHTLGVSKYWECKTSPLEIIYLPTNQKIYFRGLDDPLKITSITTQKGVLCWLWIEEAYEIDNEEDFDILQESIRGKVPEGLFKQITLTFNPWNEKHWIKKRFFDCEDNDILAITTNYMINEWLDNADKKMFEDMKKNNPRRYQVAGLGEWGVTQGLVYENFLELEFNVEEIKNRENIISIFGLDFGYTNDPTALFCGLVDLELKEIYVFDELYKKALTNFKIYQEVFNMGYIKEIIVADSAEPKSIEELRELGMNKIRAAKKGKDSLNNGIQYIQDFKIVIHPKCKNFLNEICNYIWKKDEMGKTINRPIDDYNHLLDAMRYAIQSINKDDRFSFK
ncbi:PBSX family phage terminase large subunit [uncultured Tyzzerella sp.]|uniref:PBSX family phage terminase large subunit n=1 Tax=uncultured Tyzzerella sp. TaxID=2321398 RepID=UPI0029428C31|nr:PBSX family phage terminase large subunit [uncultured Tyzzerella sp.]